MLFLEKGFIACN